MNPAETTAKENHMPDAPQPVSCVSLDARRAAKLDAALGPDVAAVLNKPMAVPGDPFLLTIADTGWKRLDGGTMRWVGPALGDGGGRDGLQIKGCRGGLSFTAAYLDPGIDPADDEAVNDEFEGEWSAVLPLEALYVLRYALDSAIGAMELNRSAAGGNAAP